MNTKTYMDEMYDYLTIPENYNNAMDLAENLSLIEQKLRDEFWEKVTDELQIRTNKFQEKESSTPKFTRKENDRDCEWFQIRKDDWEFYIISTDKEDVGINMKKGLENELACNQDKIKEIIERKENDLVYRKAEWICWRTFNNYRFQSKGERIKLLPSLRESTIGECAEIIFAYVSKLIKVCDEVNTMITESK